MVTTAKLSPAHYPPSGYPQAVYITRSLHRLAHDIARQSSGAVFEGVINMALHIGLDEPALVQQAINLSKMLRVGAAHDWQHRGLGGPEPEPSGVMLTGCVRTRIAQAARQQIGDGALTVMLLHLVLSHPEMRQAVVARLRAIDGGGANDLYRKGF